MRITAGALCAFVAFWANADTITFNGVTHEDVLVYESDDLYYVVHPSQGEVMNVPRAEAGEVSIVRDRAYRDRLMAQYEETRQARAGGAAAMAQAQAQAQAAAAAGAAGGAAAGAPPGTAGQAPGGAPGMALPGGGDDAVVITAPEETGLGIGLSDLQAAVQGMGITLQGGPGGTFSGSMPEGPVSVSASGSRTNLQNVTVSLEAPTSEAMTTLPSQMAQVNALFSGFAPWVSEWAGQQQAVVMQGGTANETRDGVQATLQSSGLSGPQVTLSLSVDYVGQ